jgi:hypothetical protein
LKSFIYEGNKKGMVLKLDYVKAYDRVSWHFLEKMMSTRGFGHTKWIAWVMSLVNGGSIAIRVNDWNNTYFRPGEGLRQGTSFSFAL